MNTDPNEYERYKDKEINELYEDYYQCIERIRDADNIKTNEMRIKMIKKIIDLKVNNDINNEYNGYPEYNNENFINEISRNIEFYYHKSNLDIKKMESKCEDSKTFELDSHQKFINNYNRV